MNVLLQANMLSLTMYLENCFRFSIGFNVQGHIDIKI